MRHDAPTLGMPYRQVVKVEILLSLFHPINWYPLIHLGDDETVRTLVKIIGSILPSSQKVEITRNDHLGKYGCKHWKDIHMGWKSFHRCYYFNYNREDT